jgi:hypothetical protein
MENRLGLQSRQIPRAKTTAMQPSPYSKDDISILGATYHVTYLEL